MPGSGPRRSGRNRAAQEEEVEDAASVDSFHSDVSEAAAGRGHDMHIRLNSQLKKVWRLALVSALSQNSLARSLARITIEDYYADRKVTLRHTIEHLLPPRPICA